MQILSTGGTMSAIEEQPEATSTLERYSPKELAGFLNAFWDDQAHRPIPTDIRWEDYAPEKVMLRFKDELKRLQPYVEGWFSERGKSLPDWPKIYFVPVEGWIDYFKANPDAARLPQGPMRDEWIASRVLYLSALCPWRYTQGIFRFAPSFAKALCSSSLKGDIPCEVFLRLPQWSIYVETPNIRYGNDILVGFWAHLQNEDISMERPALKLLLNLVKDNGEGFLSSFAMTPATRTASSSSKWPTEPSRGLILLCMAGYSRLHGYWPPRWKGRRNFANVSTAGLQPSVATLPRSPRFHSTTRCSRSFRRQRKLPGTFWRTRAKLSAHRQLPPSCRGASSLSQMLTRSTIGRWFCVEMRAFRRALAFFAKWGTYKKDIDNKISKSFNNPRPNPSLVVRHDRRLQRN